jgi:hypothetical protein
LFVVDIPCGRSFVKGIAWILLLGLLVTGCATSTVEKRRQERSASYAALPPETRALVDKGQINLGMPMDAVYIAWGKPSQVVQGQAPDGTAMTTWIYYGTSWQEYRYWNYRYYPGWRYGYYAMPTLDYDYAPTSYVAAEVTFQNGVVKNWRSSTQPPPY